MLRGARLFYGLIGLAFIVTLAACGGGGSSPPAPVTQSAPQTTSLSTSGSATVNFSAISGINAASITLPASSGSATATLTLSTHVPSGVSSPSSSTISAGRSQVQSIGGGSITVYGVIALSVSSAVTLSTSPSFSFTLPSAVSGTPYVAFFDENNTSAGWNVLLGPGTVTGNTVTFASQTLVPPLSLQTNDTYLFALISVSSPPSTGLTYTGTKSVNYAYGFGFSCACSTPPPLPSPVALSYNVTANVTPGSSPYPGPTTAGLLDAHVSESDAGSLSTTTSTTDSWVGLNTSASPYVASLYGLTQTQPSSAQQPSTTTIYGTPQVIDQYPQTGGATWTNMPTANISYSYADGSTGTRVIASNGTYVDTESLYLQGAGGTATTTENSDTSGSITGPLFSGIVDALTFAAPSAGNIQITIVVSAFGQSVYGYPPTIPLTPDPVWFTTPAVFYTETDTINANASLPNACTTTSFGKTANDVNRTITTLDTIGGFVETTVLDSYEINGLPVCLTTTDTQNFAYDEQDNQPFTFILAGSLGLEVITTTETLNLTSGGLGASTGAIPSSAARSAAAAMQAHTLTALASARAVRLRNYIKAMRSAPASTITSLKGGAR